MSVMSKYTSLIAKLKLNKAQIKAIQGKEAKKHSLQANAPNRMHDFFSNQSMQVPKYGYIEILVKTLTGKTIPLHPHPMDDIADLKYMV